MRFTIINRVKSIITLNGGRRDLLLAFAIFLVLAYCIFANTFFNEWTMDDLPVIVNNPDIQSFHAFMQNARPLRPLREITFMLDHAFFGLKPMGYHIQQIFWHGLNAFLIFVLISRLAGNKAVAWTSSLLFLVHPIQVEVVANISHRKESLVLAFSLLSLLSYTRIFDTNKLKALWLVVSLGLALIAYFAKESAVVLPIIFLAYELVFVKENERMLLKYPVLTLLVLITVIVVSLVCFGYMVGLENVKRKMHLSLIVHANYFTHEEFATWYPMTLKSWVFMLLKLLLPYNLAVEYVFPVPESVLNLWVISAVLIIMLYVLVLYLSFRSHPVIFFALLWFAAFFLPVSNLIPLSYFAADRYLYTPSVGFFILVALVLNRYLSRFRLTMVTAVLILIVMFSALTFRQNKVWNSEFTLYSNAVQVSQGSAFALSNLGWSYYLRNDLRQALYFLQKSVDVNPYLPVPRYNLGLIYERLGDREKAIYYYLSSLKAGHYMPGFFEPVASSIKKKLRLKYGIVPE